MPTLLIPLEGPLQSWGTRSRFDDRDTERMPSRSGVIGLLCAALGRPRSEPLDDFAALRMAVRADRPGVLATDFHTIQGVLRSSETGLGAVISRRHYLADAAFLVGLEGDSVFLGQLEAALHRPRWPLSLGRKSFVLSRPPWIPEGVRPGSLKDELERYPWIGGALSEEKRLNLSLEIQWEAAPGEGGEPHQDVPISFERRQFGVRRVRYSRIPCPTSTAAAAKPEKEQTNVSK